MTVRITLSGVGESVTSACPRNEALLFQDDDASFPLLSRLDACSYDVFASGDMDQLLLELGRLAPETDVLAAHLEEVITLVKWCRRVPGATL